MSKGNDRPAGWGEWADVAASMEKVAAAIRAAMRAPQAVLPDESEQRTIASMRPGETRWFSEDTVYADAERKLWLVGNSPGVPGDKRGHYCLRVTRERDGYHVTLPAGKEYLPGRTGYLHALYGKCEDMPVARTR